MEAERTSLLHPEDTSRGRREHEPTKLLSSGCPAIFTAAKWRELYFKHPNSFVVCSVIFVLALTTVVVLPMEWSLMNKGVPPVCSKGGIAVMFPGLAAGGNTSAAAGAPNERASADPQLFIFSGDSKHSVLIQVEKRYALRERVWRNVPTVGDKSSNQHELPAFQVNGVPSPRWKSVAVLANDTTMAIFGGESALGSSFHKASSNDLWLLSARGEGQIEWRYVDFEKSSAKAAVPAARKAHAASKVGSYMYMFGGKTCPEDEDDGEDCEELGDLWRLDLTHWRWEKVGDTSQVAGGGSGGGESDGGGGGAWKGAAGGGPSPRHGHTGCTARVRDPSRGGELTEYFVVFAGRADKDGYFNDIWAFNTFNLTWEDWTPDYDHSTAEFFPSKRDHHHVASVDGYGSGGDDGDGNGEKNPKMILFGGRGEPSSQKHQHKSSKVLNDLWHFDYVKKKWKEVRVRGKRPSARFLADYTQYDAAAASEGSDSLDPKLVIFGGDTSVPHNGRVDDLWELDIKTSTWRNLEQSFKC